jgi:hypothetical protein
MLGLNSRPDSPVTIGHTLTLRAMAGMGLGLGPLKSRAASPAAVCIPVNERGRKIYVTATIPGRDGVVLQMDAFGTGDVTASLLQSAADAGQDGGRGGGVRGLVGCRQGGTPRVPGRDLAGAEERCDASNPSTSSVELRAAYTMG